MKKKLVSVLMCMAMGATFTGRLRKRGRLLTAATQRQQMQQTQIRQRTAKQRMLLTQQMRQTQLTGM